MRNDRVLRRTVPARAFPRRGLLNPLYPAGEAAAPISVTRDGPNNWYVPATAEDFTALGLPVPDYLWLCQESSGDLVSAIGSLNLVASAAGNQLYQQSVTGWTRKAVGLNGSTSDSAWRTTNAALDVSLNESYAMVAYLSATIPAANRPLMSVQGANELASITATTGTPRSTFNNVACTGAQALSGLTVVNQYVWYRRGDNSTAGIETNLESVVGTYAGNARAGQVRGLGPNAASTPPAARYLWVAIYKGVNAQRDWAAYLTTLRG